MKGPSNKIAGLLIVVILVVVGVIAFSAKNQNKSAQQINNDNQESKKVSLKVEQVDTVADMDGDGLADWEEILRFSDPLNPDTDGDGTLDGEEVKQERDPTVAGPDDKETIDSLDTSEIVYDLYNPDNLSGQWSTNLVNNFLANQNNPLFTDAVGDQLIQQLVLDAETLTRDVPEYSISDLNLFAFNKELIKKYGNELAILLANEAELLSSIYSEDHNRYLSLISDVFYISAEKMVEMQVPTALANQHVGIANGFVYVGNSINDIKEKSETDPIRALFAIQKYNQAGELNALLYTEIADYFEENDIIFEDNDPGQIWNNI